MPHFLLLWHMKWCLCPCLCCYSIWNICDPILLQHIKHNLCHCSSYQSWWSITHVPVFVVTTHEILPTPLVELLQHMKHYFCPFWVVTAHSTWNITHALCQCCYSTWNDAYGPVYVITAPEILPMSLSLLLQLIVHYPCPCLGCYSTESISGIPSYYNTWNITYVPD